MKSQATLTAVAIAAFTSIGMCSVPAVGAVLCVSHPQDQGESFEVNSSPCLHKRREGVLLPLSPAITPDARLASFQVEADATFFSCMVRNFIVQARATFVLSARPGGAVDHVSVAFPITTHALYGDHNQFREISVSVNGVDVRYSVAMDKSVFRIVEMPGGWRELRYKERLINHDVHPLLLDADDLLNVAPHLIDEGYDLIIYFDVPISPFQQSEVVIEYTTNSDDFSSCCDEVRDPTVTSDGYFFYFDLTNTRFWPGQRQCTIVLRDTDSGIWAAVPDSPLTTTCTPNSITLQGAGEIALDLAAPVQPAVFAIWPRRWPVLPPPPSDPVMFEVRWLGGVSGMFDNARVERIDATPNVTIHAMLPIIVDDRNPVGYFWAWLNGVPISPPSFIDTIGAGYIGQYPHGLYGVTVRIPIAGQPITGHDLEVSDVRVTRPGPDDPSDTWTVHATVRNLGWFTEQLIATLLVNKVFVKAMDFGPILPQQERQIEIPVQWAWELPAEVEVEVEPTAGEVVRLNNAAVTIYPPPILIASDPPNGGTLPRLQNNTIRLVFDGRIGLPTGPPLRIAPVDGGDDVGDSFIYLLESTHQWHDTLLAVEDGSVLQNQTWYRIEPTDEFYVGPFVVELYTLIGDVDGDRQVGVFDVIAVVNAFGSRPGDPNWNDRCDFNANGVIDVLDVVVVVNHFGEGS